MKNPYWEEVQNLPHDGMGAWRNPSKFTPEAYAFPSRSGNGKYKENRKSLVEKYSWAIPSDSTLDFLVNFLKKRKLKVVEVGAGTGYWAWQLAQNGIDVNAYDKHPPRDGKNHFHSPKEKQWHVYSEKDKEEIRARRAEWQELMTSMSEAVEEMSKNAENPPVPFPVPEERPIEDGAWMDLPNGAAGKEWHTIVEGSCEVLALPENQDRALFLCWPPYDKDFAYNVLKAYQGNTLIYVGEGEGGCTGDDNFFKLLEKEWEEVAYDDGFTSWSGIHDQLIIYRRKKP